MKLFFKVLAIVVFLTSLTPFSIEARQKDQQVLKKVCFCLDQVYIENNSLFLVLDSSLVSIPNILNDGQNYYTFLSSIDLG